MKPHTFKGRTKSPAESERLSPAEHVLERIKTLTTELQALHADIHDQAGDQVEMLAQRMVVERQASAQVLEEFQAALDQIRGVLWLRSQETGADSGTPHRGHRFAGTGADLRTLSSEAHAEDGPMRSQARDAVSFFDRLDRVIDNYMQAGAPIGPGKRPKT